MRQWGIRVTLAVVLILLTGLAASAEGDWGDGQSAMYVIGQADFETAETGTTASSLSGPRDAAVDDRHQKLYVVDGANNRVLRYALPISSNKPAAELVIGQNDMISSTAATSRTGLSDPRGIALDTTGRLWVADTGNNRILWFNDAHALGENGPAAHGVLGQPDYVSGGAETSQSGMNEPSDVAAGYTSTIYVADPGNNRVLRFDDAASKEDGGDADGVLGQSGFDTSAFDTTAGQMHLPQGVSFDGTTLFVADTGNARVLRFDNAAARPNGADADGVLGQPNFNSKQQAITATGMQGPARVAVDSQGWLYVSDAEFANRVLVFIDGAAKASGAAADRVLGQPTFTHSGAALSQSGLDMDPSGGGVASSAKHNYLVVADDNNNRVMIFKPWVIYLPLAAG